MSCPDCFKVPVHNHAEAIGQFETLYGWKTYVTGDANAKSAILYLPDAFGLKLVNNKLLAGRYAAVAPGAKYSFPACSGKAVQNHPPWTQWRHS